MSELPPAWFECLMKDVLAILEESGTILQQGWSPQCDRVPAGEGEWGVLKTTSVQDGYFLEAENKRLPDALAPKQNIEVKNGDLLMTCAGPRSRCGVVCLVEKTRSKLMFSGKIYRFRPDSRVMHPSFLSYQLRSHALQLQIDAAKTGISESGLNMTRERFFSLQLATPPIAEQKRIAQKLNVLLAQVDTLKARIDAIPALLKRFRQAVLDSSASGDLTRSWRTAVASDDQEVIHEPIHFEHGTWPSTSIPSGWQWVPFNECYSDETDSRKKVPQSAYEAKGSLAVVDQGESLIGGYTSNLGLKSSATLPVIVFGDHTRCIKFVQFEFAQGADGVKVLVPENKVLEPLYAYFSFQACRLPNKGYSRHMKFVRDTMFPVPPKDEQLEIVRRVEQLFAFAGQLEAKVSASQKRIDTLTQSLLTKAFRGELVPQDPNDEPATVMLERIRAKKTKTSARRRKIDA